MICLFLRIQTEILGERPLLPSTPDWEAVELTFREGKSERFDLVIPCTGQTPNSSILEQYCPSAISSKTGRILVKPTLQIQDDSKSETKFKNVFSLGDVAETGGPKMARAGFVHAGIVQKNILALINGAPLKEYKPISIEGMLKLSLGKDDYVMYAQHEDGDDFLIPGKNINIDLEVAKAWSMFGADMKSANV